MLKIGDILFVSKANSLFDFSKKQWWDSLEYYLILNNNLYLKNQVFIEIRVAFNSATTRNILLKTLTIALYPIYYTLSNFFKTDLNTLGV